MKPISTTSTQTARLWTKEDVAAFAAVSPRTVDNWVQSRRIPFAKMGRIIRFVPRDVQEAIAKHVVRSVSA